MLIVVLLNHFVDELVDFFGVEVSASDFPDLVIDCFSGCGDELGERKSGVDLLVPLSEVLDGTGVEVGFDELLEEASGAVHVVVFVGPLESDIEGISRVVMSVDSCLVLDNLDGAISEVVGDVDVDVGDVDIR